MSMSAHAEQFLLGIPQLPAGRAVDIRIPAFRIQQFEPVARLLDQGAETPLALAERLLYPVARGHVLDGGDHEVLVEQRDIDGGDELLLAGGVVMGMSSQRIRAASPLAMSAMMRARIFSRNAGSR